MPVSNSALWFTINETAKKAMREEKRWQDCLTMNSVVDDLLYRGNKGIEDWLLNAGVGFDAAEFKKEKDRQKDRDLNNSVKRQTINQLQIFSDQIKHRNNSNSNNYDSRPNNTTNQKDYH